MPETVDQDAALQKAPQTITVRDRLAALRRYREEILAYLDQNRRFRAMTLMFDLDEEWGGANERRLIAFAEARQAALSNEQASDASFHDAAVELLNDLERTALEEIWASSDTALDLSEAQDFAERGEPAQNGERADAVRNGDLRSIKRRLQAKALAGAPPLLSLTGTTFSYGRARSRFSLGPIDLEVRLGQVLAVVGGNGSGKTTLLRLLSGDLAAEKGEVRHPGLAAGAGRRLRLWRTSRRDTDWRQVRRRIAYVPAKLQSGAVRLRDYMLMTGLAHGLPFEDVRRRTDVLLHRYGLADKSSVRLSELSTGNRLRFELARILMADAPLLVLDEPLANLSESMRETVLADLRMLASSLAAPRTVVISSHHVREVQAVSDDVLVLDDGRMLERGAPGEIARHRRRHVFRVAVEDAVALFAVAKNLGARHVEPGAASSVLIFDDGVDPSRLLNDIAAAGLRLKLFEDMTGGAEAAMLMQRLLGDGVDGGKTGDPSADPESAAVEAAA